MNEPIDVVYTWVNGSDTKFQEELQFFLRSKYDNVDSSKKRFDDKYELKFSLRFVSFKKCRKTKNNNLCSFQVFGKICSVD